MGAIAITGGPAASRRATGRGSIREVSLVGRPPDGWGDGRRVAWAGRDYRVVGEATDHAHLRPVPDEVDDPA